MLLFVSDFIIEIFYFVLLNISLLKLYAFFIRKWFIRKQYSAAQKVKKVQC